MATVSREDRYSWLYPVEKQVLDWGYVIFAVLHFDFFAYTLAISGREIGAVEILLAVFMSVMWPLFDLGFTFLVLEGMILSQLN